MNRPPKKKKQHKDDLVADPRFSREELARAGHEQPKQAVSGDDRNLVEIDDAFSEADIEDRVWLYWQRNKNFLIGTAVVAILAVVGINGWKLMQKQQFAALQSDYNAATGDPAKLQAFGAAHQDEPLGGLALLDVADAKYADGDYAAAIDLYRQSLQPLQGTVVSGRARLGLGMSQIKSGDTDAGKSTLTALIGDNNVLSAVRAEAAFNLAQIELAAGNRQAASQWLLQTTGMPNAGVWKSQAEILIRGEKLDVEAPAAQ